MTLLAMSGVSSGAASANVEAITLMAKVKSKRNESIVRIREREDWDLRKKFVLIMICDEPKIQATK